MSIQVDYAAVWVAVFAGECVARNLTQGGYSVEPAVKAADHAVADLFRCRNPGLAAQVCQSAPVEAPVEAPQVAEQRKGKRQ